MTSVYVRSWRWATQTRLDTQSQTLIPHTPQNMMPSTVTESMYLFSRSSTIATNMIRVTPITINTATRTNHVSIMSLMSSIPYICS